MGDPDEISRTIQKFIDVGADQLTFSSTVCDYDMDVLRESYETFGKHVIPRFDTDPVHSTTRQREAQCGASVRHPLTLPPSPLLPPLLSRCVTPAVDLRPPASRSATLLGGRAAFVSHPLGTLRAMSLELLQQIGRRQLGLVTSADCADLLDDAELRTALRRGWLVRERPGVLVFAGSSRSWEQAVLAAVLSGGTGAVASHRTAAAVWELPGFPRSSATPIEITVPRGRRPRDQGRPGPHDVSSWNDATTRSATASR